MIETKVTSDESIATRVARVLSKQAAVASKQLSISMSAECNEPITYVTPAGAVCAVHVDDFPKGDPFGLPPRPLPETVRIYLVDVPPSSVPKWHRFQLVDSRKKCDVAVVSSIEQALYSSDVLFACLFGKRVADAQWLYSRMKSGNSLCFQRAVELHLHYWLSEEFQKSFPLHSAALKEAHEWNQNQQKRSSSSTSSNSSARRFLHVLTGELPPKPFHPRLSYGVVSEAEYQKAVEDRKPKLLTLEAAIARLTRMHGPDR